MNKVHLNGIILEQEERRILKDGDLIQLGVQPESGAPDSEYFVYQ